jgi:hypothetical protein
VQKRSSRLPKHSFLLPEAACSLIWWLFCLTRRTRQRPSNSALSTGSVPRVALARTSSRPSMMIRKPTHKDGV